MNQTLETLLLEMIGPAIAFAIFLVLERHKKSHLDEELQPVWGANARPKFKVVPKRKG